MIRKYLLALGAEYLGMLLFSRVLVSNNHIVILCFPWF